MSLDKIGTNPSDRVPDDQKCRAWTGLARQGGLVRSLRVAVIACLVVVTGQAAAGAYYDTPLRDSKAIKVPLHKSRILDLEDPIARVSVANPAIADILVVNPRQIYIVGKELGTTNMVLWDDEDRAKEMLGIEVSHDLQTLKEKIHRFLPGQKIRVESAHGSVVLSGEVTSPQKMDAALRLAQSFAAAGPAKVGLAGEDQPSVLNLLQVGGAQQVLLEVKVAEISRSFIRRLDVNFSTFYNGGSLKIGAVNGGASFPDAIFKDPVLGDVRLPIFADEGMWGPAIPEFAPGAGTRAIEDKGIFGQYLTDNFLFNLAIDAAKNEGLAKILAEPNLTTLSGQEAKFLAGGEFPVPVPQDLGTVTVEFKEFGVGIVFVPVVLDSGVISLKVNVTVSDLSNENALAFAPGGADATSSIFVIPSLTKRSANASVEVPSGQTIAIAGLINETLRENVNKFPGLGDLPVLGALFRSQEYQKDQTELVIFVTPRLARPIQPQLVKLPTDDFVEPSDTEFYLLGRLQGRKPGATPADARTLGPDKTGTEGVFGHDL